MSVILVAVLSLVTIGLALALGHTERELFKVEKERDDLWDRLFVADAISECVKRGPEGGTTAADTYFQTLRRMGPSARLLAAIEEAEAQHRARPTS